MGFRPASGDLDGALEDFLECLEIWRQCGSRHNEGQTLINVGNTQAMRKQHAEAAGTLQRAAAALLVADDRDGADSVALAAGDLYLWLDRLDEASEIFRAIVNRAASLPAECRQHPQGDRRRRGCAPGVRGSGPAAEG